MMSTHSWAAQRRLAQWARRVLLTLTILAFILPLLWSFLASWSILPDDAQTPPTWSWPPTIENYVDIGVTTPGFVPELVTTIGVSAAATLLTIVISFLAAYSLARSKHRRIWALVQAFVILASIPVMAYVIPLNDTIRRLGLYDSFIGVTLADTAVFAPLAVYILYGYLKEISVDLEESARLDGASIVQILIRVVLPMTAAGIAATSIILFVLNWNLLLVPLVLTEEHIKTIPVVMSDFFRLEHEIDWPSAAAVLITSLVPLLILVTATHRVLERFTLSAARETD